MKFEFEWINYRLLFAHNLYYFVYYIFHITLIMPNYENLSLVLKDI